MGIRGKSTCWIMPITRMFVNEPRTYKNDYNSMSILYIT